MRKEEGEEDTLLVSDSTISSKHIKVAGKSASRVVLRCCRAPSWCAISKALTSHTTLKTLMVQQCDTGDGVLEHLKEIPSLRSLQIARCGITRSGVRLIARLTQLTELKLDESPQTMSQAMRCLLPALKYICVLDIRQPQLHTVNLSQLGLQDVHFKLLAVNMPEVTNLDLKNNKLTALGIHSLSRLCQLVELEIGGNIIDMDASHTIGSLSMLSKLSIINTQTTPEMVEVLCQSLNLQQLKISWNVLGDQAVASISRRMPRLSKLSATYCKLGLFSATCISRLGKLVSLQVHHNPGMSWSIKQLGRLNNLTSLAGIGVSYWTPILSRWQQR